MDCIVHGATESDITVTFTFTTREDGLEEGITGIHGHKAVSSFGSPKENLKVICFPVTACSPSPYPVKIVQKPKF